MNSKKIITVLLCSLFLGGSLLFPQKATFRVKGDGIGYVLLDDFIMLFEDAAALSPEALQKKVKDAIARFVSVAQKAVDEGKIDSLFFERYERLLRVVRLIMIDDPEGLLTQLIVKEALQFDTNEKEKLKLKEKLKQDKASKKNWKKGISLGFIAAALADEVLSLKNHLDEKAKTSKVKKSVK
jgi:hypothetical protein